MPTIGSISVSAAGMAGNSATTWGNMRSDTIGGTTYLGHIAAHSLRATYSARSVRFRLVSTRPLPRATSTLLTRYGSDCILKTVGAGWHLGQQLAICLDGCEHGAGIRFAQCHHVLVLCGGVRCASSSSVPCNRLS